MPRYSMIPTGTAATESFKDPRSRLKPIKPEVCPVQHNKEKPSKTQGKAPSTSRRERSLRPVAATAPKDLEAIQAKQATSSTAIRNTVDPDKDRSIAVAKLIGGIRSDIGDLERSTERTRFAKDELALKHMEPVILKKYALVLSDGSSEQDDNLFMDFCDLILEKLKSMKFERSNIFTPENAVIETDGTPAAAMPLATTGNYDTIELEPRSPSEASTRIDAQETPSSPSPYASPEPMRFSENCSPPSFNESCHMQWLAWRTGIPLKELMRMRKRYGVAFEMLYDSTTNQYILEQELAVAENSVPAPVEMGEMADLDVEMPEAAVVPEPPQTPVTYTSPEFNFSLPQPKTELPNQASKESLITPDSPADSAGPAQTAQATRVFTHAEVNDIKMAAGGAAAHLKSIQDILASCGLAPDEAFEKTRANMLALFERGDDAARDIYTTQPEPNQPAFPSVDRQGSSPIFDAVSMRNLSDVVARQVVSPGRPPSRSMRGANRPVRSVHSPNKQAVLAKYSEDRTVLARTPDDISSLPTVATSSAQLSTRLQRPMKPPKSPLSAKAPSSQAAIRTQRSSFILQSPTSNGDVFTEPRKMPEWADGAEQQEFCTFAFADELHIDLRADRSGSLSTSGEPQHASSASAKALNANVPVAIATKAADKSEAEFAALPASRTHSHEASERLSQLLFGWKGTSSGV